MLRQTVADSHTQWHRTYLALFEVILSPPPTSLLPHSLTNTLSKSSPHTRNSSQNLTTLPHTKQPQTTSASPTGTTHPHSPCQTLSFAPTSSSKHLLASKTCQI